ncbi:hypothetical protein V1477_004203, partial [Vespula maculifrons]
RKKEKEEEEEEVEVEVEVEVEGGYAFFGSLKIGDRCTTNWPEVSNSWARKAHDVKIARKTEKIISSLCPNLSVPFGNEGQIEFISLALTCPQYDMRVSLRQLTTCTVLAIKDHEKKVLRYDGDFVLVLRVEETTRRLWSRDNGKAITFSVGSRYIPPREMWMSLGGRT